MKYEYEYFLIALLRIALQIYIGALHLYYAGWGERVMTARGSENGKNSAGTCYSSAALIAAAATVSVT